MAELLIPGEAVTDAQREKLLEIVKDNPTVGTVTAGRQAGIAGTKGEIRQMLEPFADEIREARGWSLEKVEQTAWTVAQDTEHPAWDRANARILKAYHPAFRDKTDVNLNANVTVERREVSLHGVLHVLAEAGALDGLGDAGPLAALAAAGPVLPAQPD